MPLTYSLYSSIHYSIFSYILKELECILVDLEGGTIIENLFLAAIPLVLEPVANTAWDPPGRVKMMETISVLSVFKVS